jgi:hypothetical protein
LNKSGVMDYAKYSLRLRVFLPAFPVSKATFSTAVKWL